MAKQKGSIARQDPVMAAETLADLANQYLVSYQSLGEPIRPKDVALLITENWTAVSRAAHCIHSEHRRGSLPTSLQRSEPQVLEVTPEMTVEEAAERYKDATEWREP